MINFPKDFKRKTEDLAYYTKNNDSFFIFGEYENQKACIYIAPQPYKGDAIFSACPDDDRFINEILETQLSIDYYLTMFTYNEKLLESLNSVNNSFEKIPCCIFLNKPTAGWNRIIYFYDNKLRYINKSSNNKPFKVVKGETVEEVSVYQNCLTIKGTYKVDKKDVDAQLKKEKLN